MEKHTCNLCGRRFPNGRALGGHMRSHVISSSKAKSHRSVVVDFSPAAVDAGSSSVVQDVDSDAESSIAPSPSKRSRGRPSPEPISSSVSDATTEEEVARCLMMLSRDDWTRSTAATAEEEAEEQGTPRWRPLAEVRIKNQCGTCKKVFGSYQALGGHRAGHKKLGGSCAPAVKIRIPGDGSNEGFVHQCPFCFRVFSSGQALGGHKKSHFTSSAAAAVGRVSPPPLKLGECCIDLNLPAPEEEVEVSAVSI